jgi:Anti-sigma-D factor RsdA to sigma factor binding region
MRDDHSGAPNGRPIPFGDRASSNGRGTNGSVRPGGPFGSTRVLAADAAVESPIELVAVQADDELINALGPGGVSPADYRDLADLESGSRLVAMLAAWRAEIEAEPIPELLDLDAAVAAVAAGVAAEASAARRRRSARARHLAPLVAAAALIVSTVTGVGLGSQDAQPGDALWSVQKVLDRDRAESVEAKVSVETRLASVRTALSKGDTVTAARELDAIRTEIPVVRGQEGRTQLVQEQEFLAAKLADTPPGTPADLSTPPSSNPNARPTGGPPPAPAVPATPPADPSLTGPAGSTEPSAPPTSPNDRESTEKDRVQLAPPGSGTGDPTGSNPSGSNPPGSDSAGSNPSGPDPRSSAPEVTRGPDVPPSDPSAGKEGARPTTAPKPGPETAPAGGGAAGDDGAATQVLPTTSDTTTASGSAGTSVEATATTTTN